MSKDIKSYAQELEIRCLLHFTKISNLESILTHGLLSRDKIATLATQPEVNDELRLDNHTDTISLSISHPNSNMFYKYRQKEEGEWCVIGVRPRVLWTHEVMFCKHNAADARIISKSAEELSTASAFRGMFEEIAGHESREEQALKKYDPTDVQAEVLVSGAIQKVDFLGVVFPSRLAKKKYSELLEDLQAKIHIENKGYFASRSYQRKYN